jgi:hypothetical protein
VEATVRTADVLTAFRRASRSSFWLLCADFYPALVAACIPWSTTAVASFMAIWLVVAADDRSTRVPEIPEATRRLAVLGILLARCLRNAMVRRVVDRKALWSKSSGEVARDTLAAVPLPTLTARPWAFITFLSSCAVFMLAS